MAASVGDLLRLGHAYPSLRAHARVSSAAPVRSREEVSCARPALSLEASLQGEPTILQDPGVSCQA